MRGEEKLKFLSYVRKKKAAVPVAREAEGEVWEGGAAGNEPADCEAERKGCGALASTRTAAFSAHPRAVLSDEV